MQASNDKKKIFRIFSTFEKNKNHIFLIIFLGIADHYYGLNSLILLNFFHSLLPFYWVTDIPAINVITQ